MEQLINKAKQLLEGGKTKVVIGYAKGSGGRSRAFFAKTSKDAEKLIMDKTCLQNLAVYISKQEVKEMGRAAIVARTPVLRALLQLAQENQIAEADVDIIGVSDDLKLIDMPDFKAVENYLAKLDLKLSAEDGALIEKINKMTVKERWQFWTEEFSRCIKCYACRSSCPMCYCSRCLCDCNQPQVLSVPSHLLGNIEWHIIRAMHLAGRCVACGDCGRACPVGIPLHLLTEMLGEDIMEEFGSRAGTSADQ
ncbi:MAG TPA: 4Fe-4S dicluster domain-containing protein, partial [Candidatus Wallbacteria bacterium]|nr:4Fe-4S dicluster domain-containing protein [Candidatus Wallbacteria bacterium]